MPPGPGATLNRSRPGAPLHCLPGTPIRGPAAGCSTAPGHAPRARRHSSSPLACSVGFKDVYDSPHHSL
ncbi:hypothetical protein NDU88_006413 [Pleurodeles waltl]|uniref:Uncharacterized protein n=1 Tax=Pleurodeles waltl TaxID=8319 RepID=A0AAV7VQF7_PLEWA|nr:hypothetical protein NDU88_006413 [Pleurodeles waltl]